MKEENNVHKPHGKTDTVCWLKIRQEIIEPSFLSFGSSTAKSYFKMTCPKFLTLSCVISVGAKRK